MFDNITNLCLCGSGKLYSECCQNKIGITDSVSTFKRYMHEFDTIHKKYKKICLHPKQSECGQLKIHAHTISQKAVLEIIAEKGIVLMPIVFGVENQFRMQPLGIEARATKFYCFCDEHDKMFYPIDKREVVLSAEVYFLYAYRIFASTYYKIMREIDCYSKLKEKYDLTSNPFAILNYMQMQNNLEMMNECKMLFDNAIINEIYDCLESINIRLDYKVYFAAASCCCPMFDVFGNELVYFDKQLPLLFISVMPDESYTNIIISWLKKDANYYTQFREQISKTPTRLVLKYINNLLPLNCENITIGPQLWNAWGEEGQSDFVNVAYNHLYEQNIKIYSETYFKERKYNLFKKI